MGLTLHLPATLTCPTCGCAAHLMEGRLARNIGQGITVTVDSVPVYRCESCLSETMEFLAGAQLEDHLKKYLRDVQPRHDVSLMITWGKSPTNKEGARWDVMQVVARMHQP